MTPKAYTELELYAKERLGSQKLEKTRQEPPPETLEAA